MFDIWSNSLLGWILSAFLAIGIILIALCWRLRKKNDPKEQHLDYFCRCYARGEISREDFEELKKDLQEHKKQNNHQKKVQKK
jgi:uncharacterized membrane protein